MHPSSCNCSMNCDCNKIHVRPLLFRVVTQHMLVVVYWCYSGVHTSSSVFAPTWLPRFLSLRTSHHPYHPLFNRSSICSWHSSGTAWPFKMGSLGCSETLVNEWQYMLCNETEQWRTHAHHGGGQKSYKTHVKCLLPSLSLITELTSICSCSRTW